MTKHYHIEDIQAAHEKAGGKFFSPGAKRFFNSRIGENSWTDGKLWYFITTERFDYKAPRLYSVRGWKPENPRNIETISKFQEFKTRARAVAFINELIKEKN